MIIFNDSLNNSDAIKNYWQEKKTDDFSINVSLAIQTAVDHLKSEEPTKGLIPATYYPNIDAVNTGIKNELRADIHKEFNLFDELDSRCSLRKELKKANAKIFTSFYEQKILKNTNVDLFFDSGSSIAYVAQEFGPFIKEYKIKHSKDANKLPNIYTNSALTFMHLWMKSGIACTLYPVGPPEPPYGTANGVLSNNGETVPKEPDYVEYGIDKEEEDKIKKFKKDFPKPKNIMIVAGLSGIKIGEEIGHTLNDDYEYNEDVSLALSQYRGIHVGDYYSKIMTRALMATSNPIMFCIHAGKINYSIRLGKCHLIFNSGDEWDKFITSAPVAFCIGYEGSEYEKVKDFIKLFKLKNIFNNFNKSIKYKSIIVSNALFENWLKKL